MSAQFCLGVVINAAINAVLAVVSVLFRHSLYHRWGSSGEAKAIVIIIGIMVLLLVVAGLTLMLQNL